MIYNGSFGRKFHWVDCFQSLFIHATWVCSVMTTCLSYTFSPKEKIVKYRWRTFSRWQDALNPMVNSKDMTYTIVVSIPTENDRYTIIHHHLSPKWRPYVQRCTDSVACVMRTYSLLMEGGHKTFLNPQTLGAWSWPVAW
jgi:hypothetical protein